MDPSSPYIVVIILIYIYIYTYVYTYIYMYLHKWCTCVYMHWWALQSRGGALVDQPLQRWPTGRSSTPGGGQLLDTSSLEVYKHIQIYVYVYIYTSAVSTYVHIQGLALRFREGALVGQPFQGWPTGGSSAMYIYIYIYTLVDSPLQRRYTGESATPAVAHWWVLHSRRRRTAGHIP